jgi:galactokinase
VRAERCRAFGPGRVNLIGEHTDYNGGLALPFAIEQGISVTAEALEPDGGGRERVRAEALDLGEHDDFALAAPPPAEGWRAFVHGVVAELGAAGWSLRGARVEIGGELPRGAGLSSSAALEVALCLALIGLAGGEPARGTAGGPTDPIVLARLCSRVESEWVGAQTGLLDQLASLCGAPESAVLIDFSSLTIERVPLVLDGWRLAVLDSGQRHAHASSGYNERRTECARACELLGVDALAHAEAPAVARLPEPLRSRARHVLEEDERVRLTVAALRRRDLRAVGALLDASHASLRDLYAISTPAVERAVARLREAGAAGARILGGGFGGSAVGLFPPGAEPPEGALAVRPGRGARVLEERC